MNEKKVFKQYSSKKGRKTFEQLIFHSEKHNSMILGIQDSAGIYLHRDQRHNPKVLIHKFISIGDITEEPSLS